MLDDDHFVGCAVFDRAGTPLGTITAILRGDPPRALVRRLGGDHELALADALFDSEERTFRLPHHAPLVPPAADDATSDS